MGYGANGMNSSTHQPMQQTVYNEGSPLISVSPITLTGAQLRWILVTILGAIWSAYAAGWLFLPAKDADVKALTVVVQSLATTVEALKVNQQAAQADQKEAVRVAREERKDLVESVDALSTIVADLKNAPPRTIERYIQRPTATRAAPARRPATN